jgi:hypothetical protein
MAATAIVFLISASRYPQDARAFPVVIASVLLGLSALDILGLTDTATGKAIRELLNPAIKIDSSPGSLSRQATAVLSFAGLAAALVLLGIAIAVPLYLLLSLRLRARRPWLSSLAITAGVSAAAWLLFVTTLRLELYRGVLLSRLLSSG